MLDEKYSKHPLEWNDVCSTPIFQYGEIPFQRVQ